MIHNIERLYAIYSYKIIGFIPHVKQYALVEKEMATHSSVLTWRIPGTGEPGGLLSIGSHRVRQDWSDLAAAAAAATSRFVSLISREDTYKRNTEIWNLNSHTSRYLVSVKHTSKQFNHVLSNDSERAMAPHSSTLAWRIPGTGVPGRLVYGVAQSRTRLKQLSSSSK